MICASVGVMMTCGRTPMARSLSIVSPAPYFPSTMICAHLSFCVRNVVDYPQCLTMRRTPCGCRVRRVGVLVLCPALPGRMLIRRAHQLRRTTACRTVCFRPYCGGVPGDGSIVCRWRDQIPRPSRRNTLLRVVGAFLEWRIWVCGAGMMGLLFPIVSRRRCWRCSRRLTQIEAAFIFALKGEVAEFAECFGWVFWFWWCPDFDDERVGAYGGSRRLQARRGSGPFRRRGS